jgi:hypothetical protein
MGLKPKNALFLPHRIAIALQADGWRIRSTICWSKGLDFVGKEWGAQETVRAALSEVRDTLSGSLFGLSADLDAALKRAEAACDDLLSAGAVMPESVTSRPTTSHEYLFYLTPGPDAYFDIYALRSAPSASSLQRIAQSTFWEQEGGGKDYGATGVNESRSARKALENFARNPGRNPRTVWALPAAEIWRVPTESKGTFVLADGRQVAHYAAFPSELPARAIRGATSEAGACATCGAPWARIVKRMTPEWEINEASYGKSSEQDPQARYRRLAGRNKAGRALGGPHDNPYGGVATVGWAPTCTCHGQPGRALVSCDRCRGTGFRLTTVRKKDEHMPLGEARESHKRGVVGNMGRKSMEYTGEPCPVCKGTGEVEGDVWDPAILDAWPRVPCTVLDPMGGTGTTALAALSEGRSALYGDLSPTYADLARERLAAWPDELPQVPSRRSTEEADEGPDERDHFQLGLWEDTNA